jgi:hypothetical protein
MPSEYTDGVPMEMKEHPARKLQGGENGSGHPTRQFCHSSTVEGYRCYILRAIFLRGPPHVLWEFISVSLPRASARRREVGAWRPVLSPCVASPNLRPPGSS